MHDLKAGIILTVFAGLASSLTANDGANNPCAQIAAIMKQSQQDVENVDIEPALITIESASRMSELQSDLEFLANPPEGYPEASIDIQDGLQQIKSKATSGHYSNEYDFEMDLAMLFIAAYDFHFAFIGELLRGLIYFTRPEEFQMISASKDGKSEPKIYRYADALISDPPEVTKINGQDAADWLRKESDYNPWNNPHARFNLMFYQSSFVDSEQFGQDFFLTPLAYPGPTTELTFSNGNSTKANNMARIPASDKWSEITDGKDLYDVFVRYNGMIDDPSGDSSGSGEDGLSNPSKHRIPGKLGIETSASSQLPSSYPSPDIVDRVGSPKAAGFFINTPDEDNVAVLVLPTFADEGGDANPSEYEKTFMKFMQSFLEECKSKNSPRLILDVRTNGGGFVNLGLEAFRQLFPKQEYFQGTRLRMSPVANLTIQGLAMLPSAVSLPWDYRFGLDVDGKPFNSPAEMIGDNVVNGEQVTEIIRTGTASLQESFIDDSAVFAEEDILLLSNGACGSTCSRFVEMLVHDVRVHTLAVGGLPQNGPMPMAGGSKGAQVIDGSVLLQMVRAFTLTLSGNALKAAASLLPIAPGVNIKSMGLNAVDQIRDAEGTVPTQFIVDNADCRIWYTPESFVQAEKLWMDAYTATWGKDGKEMCVTDSTGHTGTIDNPDSGPDGEDGSSGGSSGGDDSDDDDDDSSAIPRLALSWMQTSFPIIVSLTIGALAW